MQNKQEKLIALIYNRVSSVQQETEGSGLLSQEHRCIQYAESKGYIVEKERIFHDTFSGGGDFMRRPAMRELLEYIDDNPKDNYVVIFDDLKRFARDTKFHIELRSEFNVRKVKVECLNFNFEDTPEGNFVETILAAQNQLEREQNRRQVIQKQKSRLESGYWAFHGPVGYKMTKVPGSNGKIAVPDHKEEHLKEALVGFANYRFTYVVEVAQFLKDKGVLGKSRADRYIDSIKYLLSNPFYAGFIEYKEWDVKRIKGVHKPIISEDIYYKNIERLSNRVNLNRIRIEDNEEFEFRRLVDCIYCFKPLTGCFCKGRSKRYPYYSCQTRGCPMSRKSVERDFLDDGVNQAIKDLKPTEETIQLFISTFEECWNETIKNYNNINSSSKAKINELEKEIDNLADIASSTKSDIVRSKYEYRIEKLVKELESFKIKSNISIDFSIPYQTALQKVTQIAKDPYGSWDSHSLSDKKKLFYFFFEENIGFDIKNRYQTAKPSVLYSFLDEIAQKADDVEMAGIEPACKRRSYKSLHA